MTLDRFIQQALEAAYLKGRFRMTQEEIRRQLDCSQGHVSKLLKYAEDERWLVTDFVPPSNIDLEGIEARFQNQPLRAALAKLRTKTGVNVARITVFKLDRGLIDARLSQFGMLAAGRLYELISRAHVVGVTFGMTVAHIIEGLASFARPRPLHPTFIPLCGELTAELHERSSSTRMADRLRDIVTNGTGERVSLNGVHAFLSHRFTGKRRAEVEAEFIRTQGHQRIFGGGASPLIDSVDTVFTSFGRDGQPIGTSLSEFLEKANVSIENVTTLAGSDLGGVLVPRPRLTPKQDAAFQQLNSIYTCTRLHHLENIAVRSRQTGAPGIVVLGIGKEKRSALANLLAYGLANELIIDAELAGALELQDYPQEDRN
jgi:DNA-binding transcriptional regulator LsrR (DeoR family)